MDNDTQKSALNSQLQSHYLQQQLTPAQLKALKQLKINRQAPPKLVIGAIAATIFLSAALIFYPSATLDYTSISQQIAYNHNAKLQMEVLSPTMSEVQGRLNRLGFSLVSSKKLDPKKWQLIGGRYCNINGKIAAQMQIAHPETKAVYTFYQAKMSKEMLENFSETETAIDGVKVKLWREKGLLMGLAF